jgi:hypothetical protein
MMHADLVATMANRMRVEDWLATSRTAERR